MASSRNRHVGLDPRETAVATVYAKAFLGAAEKSGQPESLIEELESLIAEILERFPKWEDVLVSRLVSPDDKVAAIDRVLSKGASPTLLNFLKVLAGHGRFEIVRTVARVARELFEQSQGRVPVHVRTASPLSENETKNLTEALRGIAGREPRLKTETDPSLIGGIILRLGDTVYDASVAARLEQLRAQMINRSVHEIQSRRDRFRHSGGN